MKKKDLSAKCYTHIREHKLHSIKFLISYDLFFNSDNVLYLVDINIE